MESVRGNIRLAVVDMTFRESVNKVRERPPARFKASRAALSPFGDCTPRSFLASGLGTIYFADSTWGGTEDWIAAFVWGSTIQTALNLGRRVLPGAVKTLTSGG